MSLVLALLWPVLAATHASSQPASCDNPVVCENQLPGVAQSTWDVTPVAQPTIEGFADDESVNAGQTLNFKITTAASAYHVDIYRLGYYGGAGARFVTTIYPSVRLPTGRAPTGTTTTPPPCSARNTP